MRPVNPSIIAVACVLLLGVVVLGFFGVGRLVASDPDPLPEFEPLHVQVQQERAPASAPQIEPPAGVSRSAAVADHKAGTAYTYRDGQRTMTVMLQNDLTVQQTDKNTADDVVLHIGTLNSIVQKQAQHGPDAPPVFRSESGGGLMTLPGGVLLALDPSWTEDEVSNFFETNGIGQDSVSPLGSLQNSFMVETASGFPALDLANTLAQQDGVVLSSPNWWRETEAK